MILIISYLSIYKNSANGNFKDKIVYFLEKCKEFYAIYIVALMARVDEINRGFLESMSFASESLSSVQGVQAYIITITVSENHFY